MTQNGPMFVSIQGQRLRMFKVLIYGGVPADADDGGDDAPTILQSGQRPRP